MSKSDAWKNWEGRTVDGRFPLRQWLGSSEQSAVFLTERPGQNAQKAAIKFVELNGADPEHESARLRAAASLSHPHLIRILANGRCQIDGSQFVYAVMEYAEEDLAQILPQRALSPVEVADLLPPVLDALSYIHEKGFVHGHLKPSNVQAVQDQLKLSSDQLVSATEPNMARKRMGVFDAPETTSGKLSPAADVWSLGVTIVDALTQNLPSQGPNAPGVPKDIPEPFRGIVRDCLHLDPKMRCTVSDIQARLKPGASIPPPGPVPTAKPEIEPAQLDEPSTPEPSSKARMFVIGAILLIVAAMAVWGLLPKKKMESAQPPAATEQPAVAPPSATSPGESSPSASAASAGKNVRKQMLPDIPPGARKTISGTIKIVVHVDVDASGKVSNAKLKSPGPSRYFSTRALDAAREWEFTPPEANGRPVASAWLITYHLRRSGIQASAEQANR